MLGLNIRCRCDLVGLPWTWRQRRRRGALVGISIETVFAFLLPFTTEESKYSPLVSMTRVMVMEYGYIRMLHDRENGCRPFGSQTSL